MKNIFFLLFTFFVLFPADINVSIKSTQWRKSPMALAIHQGNKEFETRLIKDICFTNQFEIKKQQLPKKLSVNDIAHLYKPNTKENCVLALHIVATHEHINWALYNTRTGKLIAQNKNKKVANTHENAHKVADQIWPYLTGHEGFFSTKIAYCKDVPYKNGKHLKYLCIADFDGSSERTLVSDPTIIVAPRWNKDPYKPLLFYSLHTNENMQLRIVDMQGKKMLASNFDGLNMLPSFSADGTKFAYCASRADGHCQIYYLEKGVFKKITHNEGNNVSPTISKDGSSIYFCSDFQERRPQLYRYDMSSGKSEKLTTASYCGSPSYCARNDKVAYVKRVEGYTQIFTYDSKDKTHKQITRDPGHKQECSWSPCGNFIIFSEELGRDQRIAMANLITGKKQYLTARNEVCTYPDWSIPYNRYIA